ncbi:MAG: endonuclease MutS2 [Solobacterium sp.]|nr:endonuclease MutS2 [Solobacterium sp.]
MNIQKCLEFDVILNEVQEYCAFSLSKSLLRETEISYDPLIIELNSRRASEALALCVHEGSVPMYGMKDLREALQASEKGSLLSAADMVDIIRFLQGCHAVISYGKSHSEIPHPALDELFHSMTDEHPLLNQLCRCIDDYGEVLDSASPLLRSIRADLLKVEREITSAAGRFMAAHSDSVVDSIVSTRGMRTVILVKAADKNIYGGMVHGESASGQASYIEPGMLVPLNNSKEELQSQEREEVARILRELSGEISKRAVYLLANLETCALLDTIFAKASWGKDRDGCTPELTQDRHLAIVKARHPLIDPAKVVVNTYHLEAPRTTLLITGPNTGGKTVSMKIIGLFTLLSYVGIPIPCESAVIPYFDRVFADIGDNQSVSESLSSFSAHIQAQAEICREATPDSLVLADEIGSGTDPIEGESLAIAILNELRARKCMTVATTHYSRLKAYGKRHEDIALATVQFDMKTLMPTYHYMEGLTGQSNALEVASRYGLPDKIVNYARVLKKQARSEADELIDRLEIQMNENAARQEQLDKALRENEEIEKQLMRERTRLEAEKDRWLAKRDQKASAYLEGIRREADELMKELREEKENIRYHEAIEKRRQLNRILQNEEPAEEKPADKDPRYAAGDIVELRANDAVCRIIRIGRKDIIVELNGREMHVKPAQIRPSLKTLPKKKEESRRTFHGVDLSASVSGECNLIGKRVEEAMEILDAYLDQARLHRLPSVRIIHGDGTGALRKAVHSRLEKDKTVKEYRLGMPQEGGTGATVVVFR